jgi:uncharacterized protein YfaP (DUF2135 family)
MRYEIYGLSILSPRPAAILAILLSMTVISVIGCSTERPGAISGKIVGGMEVPPSLGGYPGCPISGALVFIPDTSHYDITDENGEYNLEEVPVGVYTLKVNLLYLTLEELEVEVKRAKRTHVPELVLEIPSYFVGGWGPVGFYNKETDEYIGDVYVHSGSSPSITPLIRGELHPLGDESVYLEETLDLTLQLNDDDPIPIELTKNLFEYEEEMILINGKNTISIVSTNPRGDIQSRSLSIYYYPSGVAASLKWEGEGDLDLHLIGPEGDCYYGNVHPDWGVKVDKYGDRDEAAVVDDPRFHFDRRTGWISGGETIGLLEPAPGDYTLTVHYYGCSYPSLKEEPLRPIVMLYLNQVEHRFVNPVSMLKGNTWNVASFSWPDATLRAPASSSKPIDRANLPSKY